MMIFKNRSREVVLAIVIIGIGAIISMISSSFFTLKNFANILDNNSILGIMSIGMMLIITTGNIDRSVGAQFAVSGMITAAYVRYTNGNNILMTFVIAILSGLVLGLVNGFFVSQLSIPAIVVTLGTWNILRGTLYVITNGNMIQNLSGDFTRLAVMRIGPFTVETYIWLLVMLSTYFILFWTRMGRDILAVGGNKSAAERIGINPSRIYFFAFGYMGILSGLASALSVSKIKMAAPTSGNGYEITLIAATVIGGTAFAGGVSSVFGTFLGILLLGMIYNGLVMMKVPVFWQDLLTGLIIIIAVTSSALQTSGGVKRPKHLKPFKEGKTT